jgi:hypothetical protein
MQIGRVIVDVRLALDGDAALGAEAVRVVLARDGAKARPAAVRPRELVSGRRTGRLPTIEIGQHRDRVNAAEAHRNHDREVRVRQDVVSANGTSMGSQSPADEQVAIVTEDRSRRNLLYRMSAAMARTAVIEPVSTDWIDSRRMMLSSHKVGRGKGEKINPRCRSRRVRGILPLRVAEDSLDAPKLPNAGGSDQDVGSSLE